MIPPADHVRPPIGVSPLCAKNWIVPPSGADGIAGVTEMVAADSEMAVVRKLARKSIETVSDLNIGGGPRLVATDLVLMA